MTPFATIEPVNHADVTLTDDFWGPRVETLREATIEYVGERLVESGRIENFRIAAGERDGEFNGVVFDDSDVYKWLEAASYLLADAPDPELADRVSDVVDVVAAAQEADGYLNTYFTIEEPGKRWTNLHRTQELYCAGRLFEAAVAHHEATGNRRLLDVARAFADHVDGGSVRTPTLASPATRRSRSDSSGCTGPLARSATWIRPLTSSTPAGGTPPDWKGSSSPREPRR